MPYPLVTYHYMKEENGGSVVIDNARLWTTESLLFMRRLKNVLLYSSHTQSDFQF